MTRYRGTLVLLGCVTAWIVSMPCTALAQDSAGPRQWSWGSGDERGAGNLITPESILEALSQVTRGEVIELSHDVVEGAPFIPGLQPPYGFGMHLTTGTSVQMFAQNMGATNGIGVNLEQVELTMHVSTHIDAIGHISIGNTLYGGATGDASVSENGISHGGIEKAPPFIVRAILIDVAAYKGVDRLDPGYAIQPDDLEGALQRQGVDVSEGTIVLSLRLAGESVEITILYLYFWRESAINLAWPMNARIPSTTRGPNGSATTTKRSRGCRRSRRARPVNGIRCSVSTISCEVSMIGCNVRTIG